MKTFIIFLFLVPFLTFSQNKSLSYIESSNGLNYPDWDGGNSELEFADMNGDGFVDIVSVGDHGNPYINTAQHGIMVYFNDGTGSWTVQMTGNFGYGGIAIGDVNDDGFWDAGYGIHHDYSSTDLGDQILEVALGDGTGINWTAWDDGLATNGEDWGMFGTDFADVDNDGDLDVGSTSFGCCAGVHVYLNQMDGSWVQSYGFLNGNSSMRFVFGDMNNDGNADFVVAHQYGIAYFGDGTGNFVLSDYNLPNPGSLGVTGPSLGDINNDGSKELAFALSGGVQVWTWDESEEQWVNLSSSLPVSGSYEETQLYDMNADGNIDLAAYGNGTFTLWLGDGTGNWTQETQFTTTGITYCAAFRVGGDIDHNGYPDIVLVAEGGSWPNYQNHMKCYKETSAPDSLSIIAIFPHGNEVFYENSAQFIDWISAVPGNVSSMIKLEYSIFGSNGPWSLIADSLPNNGRYQWNIPQANSPNCFIKYTVLTDSDTSAHINTVPFTIIGDAVLEAEFIADSTYGEAPFEVHFTDLSLGNITSWEWDFDNDGNIDSYDQNPDWIYSLEGIYTVSLTISDGQNSSTEIKENYIEVLHPPVANFTADPLSGYAPLEVNFTCDNPGSNSYWEWDFENDGLIDSFEENPIHIYDSAGVFSVKLIVGNGLSYDSLVKEDYISIIITSYTKRLFVENKILEIFPNPFNEYSTIKFSLIKESYVSLTIHNLKGNRIWVLVDGKKMPGKNNKIIWDAKDNSGNKLKPGIYLIKLETDHRTITKKIILK
ncbi:MAG: VCBS repeat-containing protein [Bacteroidetes bacterium]|nr:VCBS repeat-containing protein [Bacteroidota bacterium]MBL7104558.1 VCBS repeat-containing protein [Bacteroidales bacterium]